MTQEDSMARHETEMHRQRRELLEAMRRIEQMLIWWETRDPDTLTHLMQTARAIARDAIAQATRRRVDFAAPMTDHEFIAAMREDKP